MAFTDSEDSVNTSQEQDATPSYMVALDTHTIADNNYSVLDTIKLGGQGVIGSAFAQTFNILPTVGNWLGGDFQQIDTKKMLQDYDDDVGKYYESHQTGIDALGFGLSSLIPGTGGVKILNAGQRVLRGAIDTGTIGGMTGRALGLLAPSEPKLLSKAVQAAIQPNNSFKVLNGNTLAALAQGAGQSALEGAAFETAVAATMYNSPVLEDKDIGDLTSDILSTSATFGVVGAFARGAKTYYTIKGAAKEIDKEAIPWTKVAVGNSTDSASSKMLTMLEDKLTMPEVPTFEGELAWKTTKFADLKESKIKYIDTNVRSLAGELAGGDQELAQPIFDMVQGSKDFSQVQSKLFSSVEASRLGKQMQTEKEINKALKEVNLGEMSVDDLTPYKIRYLKVSGDDLGSVTDVQPQLINIADKVKDSNQYWLEVKSYKQGLKSSFDPLTASPQEAEARYATALGAEIKPDTVINATDIPFLQAAYLKGASNSIKVALDDGSKITFSTPEDFKDFLFKQKSDLYDQLITDPKRSLAESAKIVDINPKVKAGGESSLNDEQSWITFRDRDQYSKPQWAKIAYDTIPVKDVDGNLVEGIAAIKRNQRLYEDSARRVFASIYGSDVYKFAKISGSDINNANRVGVGGGLFSSQNENYGTLASKTQQIGVQTSALINKTKEATRDILNPTLYALSQKPEAAVEWATLNANIRSYGIPFGYTKGAGEAETGVLRPKVLIDYEKALQSGENVSMPIIPDDIPLSISINNRETDALIQTHMNLNGQRVSSLGAIRNNQGVTFNRDPEVFYPIPPNLKQNPYFATVLDDSIAGHGHSTMLYAPNAESLEAQINAIKQADPTLTVLTKGDAEKWYKSIGQYEYERTLTDSSFNGNLKRTGASAPYLIATDPQKIVNDTLDWHLQRDTNLTREAVAHLNEPAVNALTQLGDSYSNIINSHYTGMDALSYVEKADKNPYSDYIKNMLGINTAKEFPFWTPLNQMLDRKVSALFNRVYDTFAGAKSVEDLDQINSMLLKAGYKGAPYDAMTYSLANAGVPQGVLNKFVGRANALLATTVLRFDPINALNNVVGSPILGSPELTSVLRGIKSGDASVVGKLAELKVPGTEDTVFSPAKLIGNSIARYHNSPELLQEYADRGLLTSISKQYQDVIGELAPKLDDTPELLDGRINKVFSFLKNLGAKGESITGNRMAEEFNRFVSADIMKQITDEAVKQGTMGADEAWSYINTFVNRTQGNYLASQRPALFQGPLGQAIGLFQTYQMNLAQQLLRHVGEGSLKDAALMMGLQGSIYGMRGLPAFDAINTHLIGNSSGNVNHTDLYDSVYGAAGKEAGDWLMYGMGSNALGLISPDLKFNLYTRGDINPRQVTVLPVNPANVPFVQAAGKLFSSIKDTSDSISQGGAVWQSMLQGIEHAGVNRPLAGLAQAGEALFNPQAQSYSTSSKGNIQASNDFFTLANLTRIAGAKPLDEAIAVDRAFNIEAYQAKDKALRDSLGKAIKTTLIAGNNPSEEDINKFAYEYAKTGGKQDKFTQFMTQQYKNANTSQANLLARNTGNTYSLSMQRVMGGYELNDFTN